MDFLGFIWKEFARWLNPGAAAAPRLGLRGAAGFSRSGRFGRSAVQSGALPNGIPLTLIDRSASSSTSQLRLPSLSLFPSPLASAKRRHGLGRDVRPQAFDRRHRLVETAHVDGYRAGRLAVVEADDAGEVRVDRRRDDMRGGEFDLDRTGA